MDAAMGAYALSKRNRPQGGCVGAAVNRRGLAGKLEWGKRKGEGVRGMVGKELAAAGWRTRPSRAEPGELRVGCQTCITQSSPRARPGSSLDSFPAAPGYVGTACRLYFRASEVKPRLCALNAALGSLGFCSSRGRHAAQKRPLADSLFSFRSPRAPSAIHVLMVHAQLRHPREPPNLLLR